jgi:hypothetical protein
MKITQNLFARLAAVLVALAAVAFFAAGTSPAVAGGGDDDGGRHGGRDDSGNHGGRGSDDNGGRHGGRDDSGNHGGRGSDDDGGRHGGRDDSGNHGGRGGDDNGGRGDDRVIRTGDCTGSATWKLKVKTDDGRLEVEGEVDSNQVGQTWDWTISDNGSTVAQGASTTTARSGSFSVERKIANRSGADRIVFRATNGDQACQGALTF